jgi:hypothetical protein
MVRQSYLDLETFADAPSVIQARAAWLSEYYENLDPELARQGLERLVASFAQNLAETPQELDWAFNQFPMTLLENALKCCPAAIATRWILEENLDVLARRVSAAEYLASEQTPLYSLPELAAHLGHFAEYLADDRDHLVKTGLPRRCFRSCPWLYRQLGRLYDVRRTGSPYPRDELFSDWPETAEAYTWGRYVPATTSSPAVVWEACAFEQADLLRGMDPKDAVRIEAERCKILDLKLEVLKLLVDAVCRRDTTGLWARCVQVLTARLLAEEADFWLRMDNYYLNTDVRYGGAADANPKMIPGGLTNLLELVGHVEKEIRIGTLHEARSAMVAQVGANWRSALDSDADLCDPGRVYFQLTAELSRDRPALDAVLDQFLNRAAEEATFWEEYRQRVSLVLQNEFYDMVSILVPVKRSIRLEFEPHLQTYAEWAASFHAMSGKLPGPTLGCAGLPAPEPPTKEPYKTFPSPADLLWKEVSMTFVSLTSIRIKARDISRTYNFYEMGFQDNRRDACADTRWAMFRKLAEQGGELSWGSKPKVRLPCTLKTAIGVIRKRLTAFMQIAEDPFHPYQPATGYRTKFTLLDGTGRRHEEAPEEDD